MPLKVEPRTTNFINALHKLKEQNRLPSLAHVARTIGIRPSTISEIKAGRQNIQPGPWRKFKEIYQFKDSDFSEQKEGQESKDPLIDLSLHFAGLQEVVKDIYEKLFWLEAVQKVLLATTKHLEAKSSGKLIAEVELDFEEQIRRHLKILQGQLQKKFPIVSGRGRGTHSDSHETPELFEQ